MHEIYLGDNLSVFKSIEFKKYFNKIDFIYIDPPYNTKNKFSYSDNNSSWSLDLKARLEIAKDLLKEDGVIFISIDDNELVSLFNICYEIFSKENFIALFITKQSERSNAKHVNITHEYVLCFAKNKKILPDFFIKRIQDPNKRKIILNLQNKVSKLYKKSPEKAQDYLKKEIKKYIETTGETWINNYNQVKDGKIYFAKDISVPGTPNELNIPELNLKLKPLSTRAYPSKEKIIKLYNENKLCFKNKRPYVIEYLLDSVDNISSVLNFYSRQGTNDLKKLGISNIFDTPKPVELIKFLIRASKHSNSIILDFYAGSGTTAQAVYEINKEDKLNHQYILIQKDDLILKNTKPYLFLKKEKFINPRLSDILIYRINKYLEINNSKKDYKVFKNFK